jgi:hypothetical protein
MSRVGGSRAAVVIAIAAVGAALAIMAILLRPQDPSARPGGTGTAIASQGDTTSPTDRATASERPTTAAPVVLVGAGDIAVCGAPGDSQTAALLDGIAGTVFTLGDNAYDNGTRLEYESCYDPTWGRHFDRTMPSPGNHEYNTTGAAGYYDYFGERAGDPDKGYYAYDRGAWRIYALNSNCQIVACGESSAQVAWLKSDMADHPHECTLAYWHHPRYSSMRHGSQAFTDALWDSLYEAGAEIVLAGHDHGYERFAPMNAAGSLAPGRGIVSFVVGTGGRDLYEFHDIISTSRRRDATTWGVLQLTLSEGAWSSRFVPVAGKSFTDTASGACH